MKENLGLFLLSRTTLGSQFKEFFSTVIALVIDSIILSRVKERFLIIVSFVLTPKHRSRNLPKEENSNHELLLVGSF